MTQAQFESLKPGDVIANEFGWQDRIVRKTAYGYQTRPILGTGSHQELRSARRKPGRALSASAYVLVSSR